MRSLKCLPLFSESCLNVTCPCPCCPFGSYELFINEQHFCSPKSSGHVKWKVEFVIVLQRICVCNRIECPSVPASQLYREKTNTHNTVCSWKKLILSFFEGVLNSNRYRKTFSGIFTTKCQIYLRLHEKHIEMSWLFLKGNIVVVVCIRDFYVYYFRYKFPTNGMLYWAPQQKGCAVIKGCSAFLYCLH